VSQVPFLVGVGGVVRSAVLCDADSCVDPFVGTSLTQADVVAAKVGEVEEAMYQLFNESTDKDYKRKFKTLKFNMTQNVTIVDQLFSGEGGAPSCCMMSLAQMGACGEGVCA
jgi:hypothetical protein